MGPYILLMIFATNQFQGRDVSLRVLCNISKMTSMCSMTLIQIQRRWPSAFQQKIRLAEFALIGLELQCLRMLCLVAQAVKKELKVNARLAELTHLECSSLSCSIRTITLKRQRRHGRPKYISATGNHSTKLSITATTLIWTDQRKVWTTTRTSLQMSKKCCVITQI